jgi:hypothetical protein
MVFGNARQTRSRRSIRAIIGGLRLLHRLFPAPALAP